jgi:hypothetical protein
MLHKTINDISGRDSLKLPLMVSFNPVRVLDTIDSSR